MFTVAGAGQLRAEATGQITKSGLYLKRGTQLHKVTVAKAGFLRLVPWSGLRRFDWLASDTRARLATRAGQGY